ncbi:MAG: MarR family winged helix-turn-helix transcriptional regulator, partial [Actinomycetota bacterium]
MMKPIPEPSPLEAHFGYWLRYVSNHVSHAFSLKLAAEGVTVAEWVVLRELLRLGETAPSALAESLGMTRGAISKLVERLVGKGLVTRRAAEMDRRAQRVALTAEGRTLLPRLAQRADENDAEFFGHLGEAQRRMLL